MVTNNKLREALEAALKTIRGVINSTISPHSNTVFDCRDELLSALAEPPRNCDVGTAEEQAQRFHRFCMENSSAIEGMCNSKCPCIDSGDKCHCLTRWAQLTYESEVGK